MYPGRLNFVQEAFKDVTALSYAYLLIDLKHKTPEDQRLRMNIFLEDAVQYVYLPKA